MAKLIAIKTIITADKKGVKTTIKAGDEFNATAAETKNLIEKSAAKEIIEEAETQDVEEDTDA